MRKDCAECETREGKLDRIEREIASKARSMPSSASGMLEIADKCPVHRTLTSEIRIVTRAAD